MARWRGHRGDDVKVQRNIIGWDGDEWRTGVRE
jgi:hypothetical protein